MTAVLDFAFDQFLLFRLGNQTEKASFCEFVSTNIQDIRNHSENGDSKMESSTINYVDLPVIEEVAESHLRVCIISDTHDRHFNLKIAPNSCSVLIHAGDILMTSRFISKQGAIAKYRQFNKWLGEQPIPHKIVIGGNHDRILEELTPTEIQEIFTNAIYLCNSSVTVAGITIWGTPMSSGKSGNSAFQSTEFATETHRIVDELVTSNELNNSHVDILVTHGTCHDIATGVKPRLAHISGHLHELHGVYKRTPHKIDKKHHKHHKNVHKEQENQKISENNHNWLTIAAPIMNTKYEPLQLPIVLDIDLREDNVM